MRPETLSDNCLSLAWSAHVWIFLYCCCTSAALLPVLSWVPAHRAGSFLLGEFLMCALELTPALPLSLYHGFILGLVSIPFPGSISFSSWLDSLGGSQTWFSPCCVCHCSSCPVSSTWRDKPSPELSLLLALSSMSLREGHKPLLLPDRKLPDIFLSCRCCCILCWVWQECWSPDLSKAGQRGPGVI